MDSPKTRGTPGRRVSWLEIEKDSQGPNKMEKLGKTARSGQCQRQELESEEKAKNVGWG